MTDTWTSLKLSQSVNGKSIKITQTASSGNLLHAPPSTSGVTDFVYLDACNLSASDITLVIQWGGYTSPDNHTEIIMTGKNGWERIVSGMPIEAAKDISVFAGQANLIMVNGFVHRLTVT